MSRMSRTSQKRGKVRRPGRHGRPPGSSNIPRPVVQVKATPCPRCRSTRHERVGGSPPLVRELPGVNAVTRQAYRFVVWSNRRCKDCGQQFRLREETNHDPRKDPETPW